MSLASPSLTTTSYKKRKEKITKSKQEEIERGWRERNVRLKQIGLPKETLEQYTEWLYGRGKKVAHQKNTYSKNTSADAKVYQESQTRNSKILENSNKVQDSKNISKMDNVTRGKLWVTGACTSKQAPTYTGTKIIGISQMAKSNAVPVFSNEEIIDIARMRR